ncbi:FIST signal transduction protein [Natrinema halophilum]|uniref:FIST C-terminal domain-containing protein n=1 Tax=Natrinema halophilum TaxID=1699371 RepID=A0A7D5H773_9EURY|nr:FIST N-terminal domain-containing protein [Natrinema halophilum]QLG49115.1 FIST C-terminal domain-containing protein [Natrinema halophilum]
METVVSTGHATDSESARAGRHAADSALAELPTDRVDFCHLFCSPEYAYEKVIDGVRSSIGSGAELLGCSAAGEFTGNIVATESVVVALVASDSLRFFTGLGTGLRTSVSNTVREAVGDLPTEVGGYPYLSAISLHDGLSGVGEQLALVAQQKLGPRVSVVGGAASDRYEQEATHVFTNDTVTDDAVAIALVASQDRLPIAVGHGHEPISEPMTVTAADGCVVSELDGRPAYEVWEAAVREHVQAEFGVEIDEVPPTGPQMLRIMGAFEFGVDQGGTYKIRWPRVEADDGTLRFAVEIPEGTVLRVMYGRPDAQIESARETVREAMAKTDDSIAGAFVYDCACREIILEDRFQDGVSAMSEELGAPLCGYETYGEMCLQMGQLSGFHNTSSVVMLLPK